MENTGLRKLADFTRIGNPLTLLVILVACLQTLDARAAGPRISFPHEIEDLGQVAGGEKVTVRFPFSNAGDANLIVQEVRAECGCTEISHTSRGVPPKGSGEIVAVLNTTGLHGKKQRHIHVRSNDPGRPIVTLTLVVEVLPERQ